MTSPDSPSHAAFLDRLRAGEPPAQTRQALGLSPEEYVAALGQSVLDPEYREEWPALVQARPRRPWLSPALGEPALAEAFPRASRPARLALAAGLLQIHDFWDASHEAAQQADDLGERRFSAYWHGIAHRREPDPANAAYWFRRVGQHPLFARLSQEIEPLLKSALPPSGELLRDYASAWNPFKFIDLCTNARDAPQRALAQQLQRLEMSALLDATLRAI